MGYTPPQLEVRKITGGWQLYPPDYTTTDDLTISANGTDTYPKIILLGNEGLKFYAVNGVITFYTSATELFKMSYTSPDIILEGRVADKNISLVTAGTGKVKFGDYTAGAATDSTGYITILDAAGNTRKLMVQA